MNKIIVHGRLTRDPERKDYIDDGGQQKHMTVFTIAEGHGAGRSNYHSCVAFGKTAENIVRYFTKGQEIVAYGSAELKIYRDQDIGKNRQAWVILVREFDFCGSKPKASNMKTQANLINRM